MTLQEILKDPNTLIIRVRMDIFKFIEKFRSPSHYFRTLAHSNSSIGRRKNKEFFKKYIEGGAYRTDLGENEILTFTIVLKLKDKTRTPTIDTSIKLRIQKLVNGSDITISTIEEESNENLIRLFTKRKGSELFQPFGQVYEGLRRA
jgi:hypothetical protein